MFEQQRPGPFADRVSFNEAARAGFVVHVRTGNRRAVPRVPMNTGAAVRVSDEAGAYTCELQDLSPWGLGLRNVSGPAPSVGARVQVAFGLDRWAIRRVAEVRRSGNATLGLAFADPLPQGLCAHLIDRRLPALVPRKAVRARGNVTDLDPTWMAADDRISSVDRVRLGRGGKALGHVSVSRWARSTWLLHSMAVSSRNAEVVDCWRDFFRLATTVALYADGDAARLMTFYDPDGVACRYCDGFAEWLDARARAVAVRIDRRALVDCPPPAKDVVVRPASRAALAQLAERLDHHLGSLVCDTLGWTLDGLTDPFGHADFEAEGRRRSRWIYEVKAVRPLGWVAVERLAPGPSATGMDLTWAFAHEGADPTGLLRGARMAARIGGLHEGPVLCPLPLADGAKTPTGLMVWSADGLRNYESYLGELTGPGAAKG